MGVPEIKYGDSVCFIMHVATGLWLSYMAPDAKSSRLGPLKRRVSRKNVLLELLIKLIPALIPLHSVQDFYHFNKNSHKFTCIVKLSYSFSCLSPCMTIQAWWGLCNNTW